MSDWACLTSQNCSREWDCQIPDRQQVQVEMYLGQLQDKYTEFMYINDCQALSAVVGMGITLL